MNVFSQWLSMLFSKPSLLMNPDLTDSARLASQSALAILQSLLFPALRLQACTIVCNFLHKSSSMRQACYQLNHLSRPPVEPVTPAPHNCRDYSVVPYIGSSSLRPVDPW